LYLNFPFSVFSSESSFSFLKNQTGELPIYIKKKKQRSNWTPQQPTPPSAHTTAQLLTKLDSNNNQLDWDINQNTLNFG